ncbi:MAG: KUP/HAK/KT family potassium transporter [Comamonadaceae bacterium]|nr:KUP/HAK/KT family potassium transporter [Comamonadaceae bacterium]
MMPLFKVDYTSTEMRSQIYIGSVNWFLLLAVLFVMVEFGESSRLAAAYGLAVTGTMTLTGLFMTWIFHLKRKKDSRLHILSCDGRRRGLSSLQHIQDTSRRLLVHCHCISFPSGSSSCIQRARDSSIRSMKPMNQSDFLKRYAYVYTSMSRLKGTALFFARDISLVSPYIVRTMLTQRIVYEDNIFVSLVRRDDPFGVIGFFKETVAPGLRTFEIQMGYMEVIDVEEILKEAGIDEVAIFYGLEDIVTDSIIWRIFCIHQEKHARFRASSTNSLRRNCTASSHGLKCRTQSCPKRNSQV